MLFHCNGKLHVAVVPFGISGYNFDSIEISNMMNNQIKVTVDLEDIDGYAGTEEFTFVLENGLYKIDSRKYI